MKAARVIFSGILSLFLFATIHHAKAQTGNLSTDQITGTALNGNDRSTVVLIHGWNPDGYANKFADGDWPQLVNALHSRLNGTGWKLLLFHWEADADTGPTFDFDPGETGFYNAREAANNAFSNGSRLADLLNEATPDLRKIVFVAHSAGSWAAYRAMDRLLQQNPYVVVNLVLLDPFIPGVDPSVVTTLNTVMMSQLGFHSSVERIFRMENYFANDATDVDFDWGNGGGTRATSQTFVWRNRDINKQVDYNSGLGFYYDGHGGPIRFYADTVTATAGPPIPNGLAFAPWSFTSYGYYRGLVNEGFLLPAITLNPQSPAQPVPAGQPVSLSVSSSRSDEFQWFEKNGQAIPDATASSYNFVASSTTAGKYVVRLKNGNGIIFSEAAEVLVDDPPPAPAITSVSPSTLPTSASQQRIKIIGSGFTGSSTLLFNGTISSDPTRLHYVNAHEIDYDIVVASAGNWSVKVITGSHESNSKTFTVMTPPPGTGSLVVNLSPVGANSAGAQWQVNGTYYNSSDVIPALAPGQYTVNFKSVPGYTSPASFKVNIVANAQTTTNATYTAVTATTYYLGINSDPSKGSVYRNPNRNTFSPGETVRLTANNESGWHLDYWSGDASGNSTYVDVVMNSDKTVTANWATGDQNKGNVNVTIEPPEAALAGARWNLNGEDWQYSGTTLYNQFGGDNSISFSSIPGWTTPALQLFVIKGGQTTNLVGTYTQIPQPTYLQVIISPPEAATAGAQWRVDGGAWQNSGANISISSGANRLVEFNTIAGWAAPGSQTVNIVNGQTKVVTGIYNPPPGVPLISSINPGVGALTGGTLLNLVGANFVAPATVLIGGRLASNVTVLSPTQITCFTPSNTAYGSVPVIVQTPGGNATNLNGFAYGFPRGNGLELAGNIGGSTYCVAAQGNYLFVGEGASFVVFNVLNPSAPTLVTRLALPGKVLGMSLFPANGRSYACVANDDAGIQIVDVTTPTAPVLKGYYKTAGNSRSVTVLGGVAYVADGNGGLQILDLANPLAPTLLGSASTGAYAHSIAVKVTGNGIFAYVVTANGLQIMDVTTSSTPSPRGDLSFTVSSGLGWQQIALVGNRAYIATLLDMKVLDISNPDTPINVQTLYLSYTAVCAVGTTLYARYHGGFEIYNASGATLQFIGGSFSSETSGYGNFIAIANGVAFVSNTEKGFFAISISNPSLPSFLNSYQGASGEYRSVSISGQNAYAACLHGGFKSFDVSNPALPVKIGQPSNPAVAYFSIVVHGRAYVMPDETVPIFGITTPSNPQLLGTIPSSLIRASKMCAFGQDLLVCGYDYTTYHPELAVINLTSPSSPQIRSKIELTASEGYPAGVACVGSKACVLVGHVGVNIVDLGNGSSPIIRSTIPLAGEDGSIAMTDDGNYLFVGNHGYPLSQPTLQIFDIRNPSSPALVYSNYLGGAVFSVVLEASKAYLGIGKKVQAFDISNPAIPRLTRSYDTPSLTRGLSVLGDNIYVANYEVGLTILKMTDLETPEIFITNPTFSPIYTNTTGTISLGGSASDNKAVTRVIWSNDRGGGSDATGTESWFVSNISLQRGTNILTVAASDAAGNYASDRLTVVYDSPKSSQSITFSNLADRVIGDSPFTPAAWASSGLPVSLAIHSGPAIVSSNVVTVVGVGVVTVRASQSGDASFDAAADVDRAFMVRKGSQVITFSAIPNKQIGDLPFSVNAASSVGLPVTFSVISGPASISSNIVTITGAGIVTINASQTGNTNFNAAHADRSFTVAKIPQVITFGALSRQVFGDAPFALSATASSGLDVEFSVLSGPAIVNGNILTLTGPKIVVLRASQPGDAIYAPAPHIDQILVVDGIGPSIAVQPVSQTAFVGTNAAFSVAANGSEPLGYQWRKNGVSILSATNSNYAISNVQTNHAGNYSVVVSNTTGSVTSSNALLTVLVRPLITTQPQSKTLLAGSNVTFSVVAKGTTPLNYQWRFKGTNLTGATKASYSITNVQPRHAGNYSVIVSNLAGSVTSSNAALAVKLLLTATAVGNGSVSPTNVLVNPGSTQSFKAIAFTNYTVGEWYLGGVRKQTGGTNYTLYNIQTNHAVKVVFRPIIKLYWQYTNGLNSEWRFNGTNYLTSASLPWINPAWQMVGQSDFNSDNSVDLLFQHTDGRLLLRTMKGTSLIRENLVRNGQPATPGYKLKALSDLNSDAQTDFLFQTSTNRLTTWFMSKGTNLLSSTLMQPHSSGWRVVGMADFNGDKKNDILWQDWLGHVSVWFMNGRTNTAKVNLREGKAAAAGWNISALADLDFNGQKDILLQNSKGQVSVWLMNRTNYLGSVLLRNGQTNAPGWQLKGPK